MDSDSLFRQKPSTLTPRGQDQQAVDANPSELSGTNSRVLTPAWRQFVADEDFQRENAAPIRAEIEQQRQIEREDRRNARPGMGVPLFKGANGRLIRVLNGQGEELNPAEWADDPDAGPEARKSIWDKDKRSAAAEHEAASLLLQDPAFKAKELSKKDRADIEAESAFLQESDPRHAELKAKLVADTEYQTRKAELEAQAYQSKVRAFQIEQTDPDSHWQSRKQQAVAPSQADLRAETVQAHQASRDEADAADQSAVAEEQSLRGELRQGVTAARSAEIKSRLAEIGQARALVGEKKAEAQAGIEQVKAEAQAAKAAPKQEGVGDFLRGAEVSLKQIPQLGYGVAGLIGDTLGIDSLKDWGFKGYKEAEEKAAPLQRENDDVSKAWEKAKTGDVGALVDWVQYGLGYALGQAAESAAVAVGGAIIGGAVGGAGGSVVPGAGTAAGGAGGAATGAVAGLVAKGAVKTAAKSLIEKAISAQALKIAAKQLGKEAAEESVAKLAASQSVKKAAGARLGQMIAVGGNSLAMELGSIYPEAAAQAASEGRTLTGTDIARIWGSGVAAGALEGATDMLGLDLVTGKLRGALPDGRIAASAVAGLAGIVTEGGTEVAQTGIERFGARKAVTGEEAVNEYLNAGALGALGGGVIGGGAGLVSGGTKPDGAPDTAPDLKPDVDTALASIDPELPPASPEEITRATMIAAPDAGPEGLAESVLIERELAEVEAEDAETMAAAEQQMDIARQSGDKTAIRAAQDELDAYKQRTNRAPAVRAVLKIAAGQQLDDLTSDELASVGFKDSGDSFAPMTAKEMKDAGIAAPLIRQGADGSIIITDGALKKVGEISTRARGRVKMTEAEAIQKAKQRLSTDTQNGAVGPEGSATSQEVPGEPVTGSLPPYETNAPVEFDVPTRSGKVIRVQAADAATAEQEAAAQADFGDPVMPGQAKAVFQPTNNETNEKPTIRDGYSGYDTASGALDQQSQGGQGATSDANNNRPEKTGMRDQKRSNTSTQTTDLLPDIKNSVEFGNQVSTDSQNGVSPVNLGVQKNLNTKALAAAKARFARAKKKLGDRIKEGPERAITRPDGIRINPTQIIDEALGRGMTAEDAVKYFSRILDEEIRHLAQYDAGKLLYRAEKATGPFLDWMEARYAAIWQSDFVATGKDQIVRDIRAKTETGIDASWDAMSDGDKALEAIRMMSQGDAVTEQAKLWADISESLKKALRAALAALKQFADIASPTLKSEITNLENALKQLTGTAKPRATSGGNPQNQPGANRASDGNGQTAEAPGNRPDAGDGGTEPVRREAPVSPVLVGARVEFDGPDGVIQGTIGNLATRGKEPIASRMGTDGIERVRVKLEDGTSKAVPVKELRVIDAPDQQTSAPTPEAIQAASEASASPAVTASPDAKTPNTTNDNGQEAQRKGNQAEVLNPEPSGEQSPAANRADTDVASILNEYGTANYPGVGTLVVSQQGEMWIGSIDGKTEFSFPDRRDTVESLATLADYRKANQKPKKAKKTAAESTTPAGEKSPAGDSAPFAVPAPKTPESPKNDETDPLDALDAELAKGLEGLYAAELAEEDPNQELQQLLAEQKNDPLDKPERNHLIQAGLFNEVLYAIENNRKPVLRVGDHEAGTGSTYAEWVDEDGEKFKFRITDHDRQLSSITNHRRPDFTIADTTSNVSEKNGDWIDAVDWLQSRASNFTAPARIQKIINRRERISRAKTAIERAKREAEIDAIGREDYEEEQRLLKEWQSIEVLDKDWNEIPGAQEKLEEARDRLRAHRAKMAKKEGLQAALLADDYTKPIQPSYFATLLPTVGKFIEAGVNTPEALAARLQTNVGGKLKPLSQSLWFLFKSSGVQGPAEPDWASIYASTDQDAKDENGLRTDEGAGEAPVGEPEVVAVTAPASVTKAAKKTARKSNTDPKKLKAQKEYLLAALDKAIEEAPESRAGTWDDPKAAGDAMLVQSSANEASVKPIFEKYGFPTDEGFTRLEERTRLAEEIYKRHFTKPTSEKIIEIEVPGDGTFRIVNDKQTLKDFRKNANTRFPTTAASANLPTSTTPRETAITKIGKPETNKDFVVIAGMFVSSDPQREVLHVVQSDGENVVATNGRQVLVLKRKVIGTEERPVHFDAKTQKPVKLDGTYPGWKQVIPREFSSEASIDTATVQKIAIQAKSVAGKDDGNQALHIWRDADGKMGYTLQSQDVTEPNGQVFLGGLFAGGEANPETAEFVTALNVFYFLDGLKAMRLLGHERANLKFSDVSTVLEADGVQYVQANMRLEEDPFHPLSEKESERLATAAKSDAAAVENATAPVAETPEPPQESATDVAERQYRERLEDFKAGGLADINRAVDQSRLGKYLGREPDQVFADLVNNGVKESVAANAVETIFPKWERPVAETPIDPEETPAEAKEREEEEAANRRSRQLEKMFGPHFETQLQGARNLWKTEKEWRYNALLRLRETIATLMMNVVGTNRANGIATDMIEGKPTIIDKILAYQPIKESELKAAEIYPSSITRLGYERGDRAVYSHPKGLKKMTTSSVAKPDSSVASPQNGQKPKKPKGPSPLDLLENYFRPGKIVKSYGGEDRVISFNRGDGEQWSVTVQAVDDRDNRGPRNHSTMPSNKDLIRAWQEREAATPDYPPTTPAGHEITEAVKGKEWHVTSTETGEIVKISKSIRDGFIAETEGSASSSPGIGFQAAQQWADNYFEAKASAKPTTTAVSRFRPKTLVQFKKPIVGPSGAKLTAYEWKYRLEEGVDKRGEDSVTRVSDWNESTTNDATGREVVHQFYVETPDGKSQVVSLETALGLLGYINANTTGSGRIKSLASILKTRAKNQMEADRLQNQIAEYEAALKEVDAIPVPEITKEDGPEILVGMNKVRRPVYSMGDARGFPDWKLEGPRTTALLRKWRDNRMKERGVPVNDAHLRASLSDFQKRIKRADENIEKITADSGGLRAAELPPREIPSLRSLISENFAKKPEQLQFAPSNETNPEILRIAKEQGVELVDSESTQAAKRRLEERTGAVAVFFRDGGGDTTGFTPADAPKLIFIQTDGYQVPIDWTISHELTHIAQRDKSVDTVALYDRIDALIEDSEYDAIVNLLKQIGYSEREIPSEIQAFIVSDAVSSHSVLGLEGLKNYPQIKAEAVRFFDGLPVLNPTPQTIDSGDGLRAAELPEGNKNLLAVHNLSIGNLKNVLKIGGLPVPSLAVIRVDKSAFDNFGEITLVAKPDLIDPQKNKQSKVFNADVYSPRYPQVQTLLKPGDGKKLSNWFDKFRDETLEVIPSGSSYSWNPNKVAEDIKEGTGNLKYNPLVNYAILRDNGLIQPPENIGADYEYRTELEKKVRDNGLDIEAWMNAKLDEIGIVPDERIFNGFTYSGNRRYLPHNLDTVVKLLKKGLKDGEGFNYGVPSIRATSAKPFRTLKAIQDSRDSIVTDKEMEDLKEEVNAEFLKLSEELLPFRSGGNSGFRALDSFSDDMKALAQGGAENMRHLREMYPIDDAGERVFKPMREFVEKLRHMPTEYFESKIQRGVQLSEFDGAVVPESTPANLVGDLKRRGLDVVKYPDGDKEARKSAVRSFAETNKALFAAELPEAEPVATFKKRVTVDPALAANSREQQQAFGKKVASGKLASFGNARSRLEQDIVDAEYEFKKVRKTNEDAMIVAKKRLEAGRDAVEEKLFRAALGEDVAMDAADEMAFRYLINERSEQAGNDMAKHAENMKLRMALRLERAEIARRMQIGYDRTMTPAERAQEAITDAIYTPSRKIEKYAEKLTGAKKREFLDKAAKDRIAEVERTLKKLGLDLAKVTGKNRELQLENSRLMKEVLKTKNVLEQNIVRMVQKGASLADIKRRFGTLGFEQAQEVITKARNELFAKIEAMAKAGMSREQIREAMKDGLKAAPLDSAANGMTAAEIWNMIEEDFGLPKQIPANSLPTANPKKTKAEKTKAEKIIETNPLTSDWSRPEFTDGMNSYEFDTQDREGIMERVEVIRGLAGALGKIDGLTGDKRTKAEAALKQINQILAKYGTDAKGIFEASQGIEDYGFDINDVAQVAAVSRAISMIDADIVDKASEWLYFSMLSGLQTMMVNATAVVPAAWETTVGRGVETAVNFFVRDPMSAQLGESKYILKAIAPALTRAMSNARTSFAAQHPMFDRDVLAKDVDWERVMGGKGYRTGGSISGKLGDRIRIPMRILAATDDFNTTLMACVEVGTFAYRIAKAKGMKDGSPEMDRFIRQEVNTPGSFSYHLATQKAKSAIFSNPLPGQHDPVSGSKVPVNDIGDAVGYLAGKITETFAKEHDNLFVKTAFAAARIAFFPFQRTPFNILRKGVRYTLNPFSLFDIGLGIVTNSRTADGQWQWNARGRNPELVRRAAMQLQGAMLMLLVAGLGEGDDDDQDKPVIITGSAPFSPRGQAERETAMRSGLGPYRISFRRKDGSERFGFNYGRLEPMATTLAASIDLMKSVKRTFRSGGDASDAAGAALGGFVAQAQDKSFLRGMGDFTALVTNALADPDLKDNRKFQQFLAGRVAMAMPNIIKQPIREADSQFRERSNGFMQELLYSTVPYGQKPAKIDPYGNPVEKVGTPALRSIDVTDAGTNAVNPVDSMLMRFRDKHPDKAWFPSPIISAEFKHPKTGQNVKMNAEQLAEFRIQSGKMLSMALRGQAINYENPSELDVEKVKETVSKARSIAKKALSHKFARQ